jgi:hypothetical protein
MQGLQLPIAAYFSYLYTSYAMREATASCSELAVAVTAIHSCSISRKPPPAGVTQQQQQCQHQNSKTDANGLSTVAADIIFS